MKGFILFVAAFSGSIAFAATNRYLIKTKILVDGKLVSKPQLLINEGEPAEVEETGRQQRVKVGVLANEAGDKQVKNEILMKFNVEYDSKSRMIIAAPQLLAKSGSEATIRLGDRRGIHDVQMKIVAVRE